MNCDNDERPERRNFTSWRCRNLETGNNRVNHGYGIPNTRCPSGTSPRFGFGTGYCAVNGPQPFALRVVNDRAPRQEPDPGTTTTSPPTTTSPIAYVEVEEMLDVDDMRCSTTPRLGWEPSDAAIEWTPSPTQCVLPSLPGLPSTDAEGWTNVGYRVKVTARTQLGSSGQGSSAPPFLALTGSPVTPDPAPPERVWFPYSSQPILSIDASGGGNTVVDIPGYVSVPMSRIAVSNPAGDEVRMSGGIAVGRFHVDDPRASLPYGYVPSVVMQRTVRLTATAGNVRSTATVRINSDTSYGIERWVTQ